MKRFGQMTEMAETSTAGLSTEELEAKRKARMERFGAAEVQEAQRSVTESSKGGFKMNRRKAKMLHKGKKGGNGGKSDNSNHKNNNNKQEQKHGNKNRGRSLNVKGGKTEKRFKKGNN